MSTLLTVGHTRTSGFYLGGIRRLVALNPADIENISRDSATATEGRILGITMKQDKKGFELQFEPESAGFNTPGTIDRPNGNNYVTQSLQFRVRGNNQQFENLKAKLQQGSFVFLCELYTGAAKLLGDPVPLTCEAQEGGSGVSPDDPAGALFTMSAKTTGDSAGTKASAFGDYIEPVGTTVDALLDTLIAGGTGSYT